MKSFTTQAVILSRTEFGEADRILTFLTAEYGKVRGIAKGVRKSRSKLAGGIELFSISDLTLIKGRGEINTIISTRLVKHYANIVKDLNRTSVAYELTRVINKATEDAPEPAYYSLLVAGYEALNDLELDAQLTALWFDMQLLKLAGHTPNLRTDIGGDKLVASRTYDFYLDKMRFAPKASERGSFSAHHIKFLRLGFAAGRPHILQRVQGIEDQISLCQPLLQTMLKSFVRV